MPTENPFKFLDVHTNKGAAHMVAGQAIGQGQPDVQSFVTSGVFTDRETLTIGSDVYQLVDLSTDSTVDVLTFWNNTDVVVTQTAIDPADYSFSVGQYVAVESEIAIVTGIVVNSATDWDVSFYRGVAGTTVAAHATGTTAIEVQGVTALTAGAITVPATAVTQAVGLDALAAVIGGTNRGPSDYGGVVNSLPQVIDTAWTFYNTDDVIGLLVSKVGGERAVTLAEACANAVWSDTASAGGSSVYATPHYAMTRVPSAADVTLGTLYFKTNVLTLAVEAFVYTTATGAAVAWDGTATIVDRVNGIVSLDNGGLVDWAATDTVVLYVQGAPVAVADCAVVG